MQRLDRYQSDREYDEDDDDDSNSLEFEEETYTRTRAVGAWHSRGAVRCTCAVS